MSKNDKEKLVDTVMGEAVLSILESDDDVSFDALIGQLQESLSAESNDERQEALRSAIGGVHSFRTRPGGKKAPGRLQVTQRKSRLQHASLVMDENTVKH
ncbi:hypothetical protein KXR87_21315 [Yokenella regensburgei]|uniref:hypothetical protein n=1 Tax=Yokenella regensburgei TaxID=158877 RepID=UPI003F157B0F